MSSQGLFSCELVKLQQQIIFYFQKTMGAEQSRLKSLSEEVSRDSSITDVDLSLCIVTDSRLQVLSRVLEYNSSILRLNLARNVIRDHGAAMIAHALAQNGTLLELDLSWNAIGEEGAKDLAIALCRNRRLERLNLHGNRIGDYGGFALEQALLENKDSKLSHIKIGYNGIRYGLKQRLEETAARNRTRLLSQISQKRNPRRH